MREIDDIHVPFIAWLHELEIPFVYHRPDRKSGITSGWPDFTVLWMGRVVCIEAKTPDGRVSEVQENVHAFIRKSGNRVGICRSVEECKEAVKNILREINLGHTGKNQLAQNFYIAEWQHIPFVFARNQNGDYAPIRKASVNDIVTLPKLADCEENLN